MLPNERSRMVRLATQQRGKMIVFLVCPDPSLTYCKSQLQAFAERFADLEPCAHVFAMTTTRPERNAEIFGENRLPFFILSDFERQVAAGLGIAHNVSGVVPPDGQSAFTTIVTDANRRVLRIDRDVTSLDHVNTIIDFLKTRESPKARVVSRGAPVLCLKQVLEPDFCRRLIEAYETGESQPSGVLRPAGQVGGGEFVLDSENKVRRDHFVTDHGLLEAIKKRLARRVLPEIEKAFTRQVSGVEEFKVVCYDAIEGGHFRAHRDNVLDRHAHRRFAMTLNLNTGDYEGGQLRFPEFGPDLYAPAAGDAVVFSCSLLHEAMPVTKGHRYVLLAFMFDEESRRARGT